MLGDKIKKIRKNANMTQKQLSDKLRISEQALALYEQNRRKPNPDMLKDIANILEVSVDYLLNNEVSQEFKAQSEENQELLKAVAEGLTDPLTKTLYSKVCDLKNDRDKKMLLNIIKGFTDDVDNNE